MIFVIFLKIKNREANNLVLRIDVYLFEKRWY